METNEYNSNDTTKLSINNDLAVEAFIVKKKNLKNK